MSMPRMNPRRLVVAKAARAVTGAIHEAWSKHGLTDVELLFILSEWQTSLLGRMRYSEWNPDEDGDEE